MSKATPSLSSAAATLLTKAACASGASLVIAGSTTFRHTEALERIQIIFHAQHRGCVDGLALEDAVDQLAAFGHAEDFRQRPGRRVAFEARDRARRENQHAVRGFAAERLLPR